MNIRFNPILRPAVLALTLCVFCPAARTATEPASPEQPAAADSMGQDVGTVPVPADLKIDDVKAVVIKALLARRWVITAKSDGKVVAHYERGNNVATVTVVYDVKEVHLYAVGQARGGGLPMRWFHNLMKDIATFLNQAFATK